MTYKVTLNYHGELHEFYTTTTSQRHALKNAQYQLAQKLGKDLAFVQRHFWTGDKYSIRKED